MKVVIFDMDGTVIDSGEAIYKTVNEVRDKLKNQKTYKKEKHKNKFKDED